MTKLRHRQPRFRPTRLSSAWTTLWLQSSSPITGPTSPSRTYTATFFTTLYHYRAGLLLCIISHQAEDPRVQIEFSIANNVYTSIVQTVSMLAYSTLRHYIHQKSSIIITTHALFSPSFSHNTFITQGVNHMLAFSTTCLYSSISLRLRMTALNGSSCSIKSAPNHWRLTLTNCICITSVNHSL